jgi:hypothetical protein
MYVCVCICPTPTPENLDEFYSVLENVSVRGLFPVNMNIPAPKIGALQMGPRNSVENVCNDFDYVSVTKYE